MHDQTQKFSERGLKVAFVGKEQKDEDVKNQVERGEYSLFFMGPEAMLTILHQNLVRCLPVIYFSLELNARIHC